MGGVWASWAEKEREDVTKTTGETRILCPRRLHSSTAHEVAECSGGIISIKAQSDEHGLSGSRSGAMRGCGVHIEAIIMVESSEWHSSSGYGKTCMSRWAAVRCGAHATRTTRSTRAGFTVGRRGASGRWSEGDTGKHVDSLLKSLEDLLLATGVDWSRVTVVPTRGILLSVGAAIRPLRPHEASRPTMYAATGVHIVFYIILAGVREAIMVVVVGVAVATTEVVRTKVVTAQDVAVGRLGSDIARVVVGGYLGPET